MLSPGRFSSIHAYLAAGSRSRQDGSPLGGRERRDVKQQERSSRGGCGGPRERERERGSGEEDGTSDREASPGKGRQGEPSP